MALGLSSKSRAREIPLNVWVVIALVGVWSSWPGRAASDIGTANSLPFSLNTIAQPAGTHLIGVVTDEYSKLPIANASVALTSDTSCMTATTNQHGIVEFVNINYQPSPVALQVTHEGYRSLTSQITLINGNTKFAWLQMDSRTVILLHGFSSSSAVWGEPLSGNSAYTFKSYLEANTSSDADDSSHVITIPFDVNCTKFATNARVLNNYLEQIEAAGIRSYSIVAHSMGGLIARQCLASFPGREGQIHYLIMIATPNHGVGLAGAGRVLRYFFETEILGVDILCSGPADGIEDFIPGSPALNNLNYGVDDYEGEDNACRDHDPWENLYDLHPNKVYQIAGTGHFDFPCWISWPFVCGSSIRIENDGVVATYSARLGVTPRDNFWKDSELGTSVQHLMGEHAITRNSVIALTVKNILNDILPVHSAKSVEPGKSEEAVLVQSQPELGGLVSSSAAFVDSLQLNALSVGNFLAVWQADSLAFSLRTPSGDLITPAYADTSSQVDFFAGGRAAQYSITKPESGWWQVMLTSAVAEPESLWVISSFDSPLSLSAQVARVVDPYEAIGCSALFLDDGLPLPHANVGAAVTDPDGNITTMQLFDDGTHGDQVPRDGEFVSSYPTSHLTGAYYFAFTATRDTSDAQSEKRVTNGVSFVNAMAEISVDPTGLVLSNPRPTLGLVVGLSSTFHNFGVADADTVIISLRNVTVGTVLADTTVSISAGQSFTFQAQWLAVVPDTTQFRITATLGGGAYEANYSDNSATSLARVYLIEGVSGVDGPGDGYEDGGLGFQGGVDDRLMLTVGPNPFNPSVEISFVVPEDNSPVTIDIYDLSGRLVRRLVQEIMTQGYHRIRWDGSDELGRQSASGLYFCRLDAGGRIVVRKMMTIK